MLPLLDIRNLSVDFENSEGVISAIKHISFQVNTGEVVAIVGESGSGKSVTALSILQLLPEPMAKYKTGNIFFSIDGIQTDLLTINKAKMRAMRGKEIAMVFQEPMTSLNPLVTCGNQVIEVIQLHRNLNKEQARNETISLFEKVKLPEPSSIINRYPHQLSGGQKQRVMIAMAMSCQPSLLIADEPTTALDISVQQKILSLLKELQVESGMGVIYITHDLALVAEIADRVIVMFKGDIVEQGNVQDIFLHPSHPYTQALLACMPSNYIKGKRLPVVSDFLQPSLKKEFQPGTITMMETRNEPKETDLPDEVIMSIEELKVYFPTKRNIFGKTLSEFKAVDGVSFSINKGETVGLVGESGCGKTTLGRALIRLITPTSGNIFFKGRNIALIPEEEMRRLRKNIQIIFQDPYGSLNPRLTIGSAIREPMKIHGLFDTDRQRKDKVMELLQKVDLKPEHFNRYPHEFSGGQRQRICIARALGVNPEFIICDESVSALDVSVQAQVLNLLTDLKLEFGFTSIFISHDLSVVRYVSDSIIEMKAGKIVNYHPHA